MASFESLVRPFTATDTAPTVGVTSVPTPANFAVLTVTGTGQVKTGNYNFSFNETWYCPAIQKEKEKS